ncbi:hypothetical protein ILUMI_17983 [Ignelater luminosus]|uniref:CCHC-type domain-containing protein n=1 Tax=Ignelater luminosus TaxID=2038154 RepID=A0A8K0CNI6_IGNLU|nr:hypothetical protein ILUMI_17983 [Ignelater luminosus]
MPRRKSQKEQLLMKSRNAIRQVEKGLEELEKLLKVNPNDKELELQVQLDDFMKIKKAVIVIKRRCRKLTKEDNSSSNSESRRTFKMAEQYRIKLPKKNCPGVEETKRSKKKIWSRQHVHKGVRPRSVVFGNPKYAKKSHGLRGPGNIHYVTDQKPWKTWGDNRQVCSKVEAMKERDLAYSLFAREKNKPSSHDTKRGKKKDEVSTTSGFMMTGIGPTQQNTKSLCAFCNGYHASQECRKTFKLNCKEKIKKAIEEMRCFKCLQAGHAKKKCKAKVTCVVCGKSQYAILCRGPASQYTPISFICRSSMLDSKATLTITPPANKRQASNLEEMRSSSNLVDSHGKQRIDLRRSIKQADTTL